MALTGRSVLLVLLGVVPVLLAPAAATVAVWMLAVALLVAADVLAAPRPDRLLVRREPTEPVHRGETTATVLHVTNPGTRRVRALVRDAWQPSAGATGERHRIDLPPGGSTRLTTTLVPTRRGDRLADAATIRILGPLGLAARQRSLRGVGGSLRVLPAFPSRVHLPRLLAQLRVLDGRAAVRTRGQGTEFDSLRDYVDGDDVRSIDWRATARRTSVVVRTWRPERDRHIVVVLDTSRTSAARVDDIPRLDASMDAGLLLTAVAARAGDRVDLVAGDRVTRRRVVRSPRTDVLHDVIGAMAPLEPALVEADWGRLVSEVLDVARTRALVVLLTALDPAAVRETLLPQLPVLTSRHRVVLASVQDEGLSRLADLEAGGGSDDAYAAAAAEHGLTARSRASAVLSTLGVHVIDASPDDLAPTLTRHYLELKDRGLL